MKQRSELLIGVLCLLLLLDFGMYNIANLIQAAWSEEYRPMGTVLR